MNNFELQASRKLLMLDVTEAAEFVGNVSTRSWQYWEQGKYQIPVDVAEEVVNLIEVQKQIIDDVVDHVIANNAYDSIKSLPWYHAYEDFLVDFPDKNKMNWRLLQSIAAHLFTAGLCEELTNNPIDKECFLYQRFL